MKHLKLFEELYDPKYQPKTFDEFCDWLRIVFNSFGDEIYFERVFDVEEETVDVLINKILSTIDVEKINKLIYNFENNEEWMNYYQGSDHTEHDIVFKFKYHPAFYQ